MNIHQIIFSPTGNTKRVCEHLFKDSNFKIFTTDIGVKATNIHLPDIAQDDLVIIAMPVFAGRVPSLAIERLKNIASHNARCVIMAVYGNRAYDDALLEMQDSATSIGFRVIAAVTAIAEHSIANKYGNGRPDQTDAKELATFGTAILKKIQEQNSYAPLTLPGHHPYRQGCIGPFPEANEKCDGCGICANFCPTEAIPTNNLKTVDKNRCIGCMRCVSICPKQARSIGQETLNKLIEHLKPFCSDRKNNELFL